jgi:hypothetical protein
MECRWAVRPAYHGSHSGHAVYVPKLKPQGLAEMVAVP